MPVYKLSTEQSFNSGQQPVTISGRRDPLVPKQIKASLEQANKTVASRTVKGKFTGVGAREITTFSDVGASSRAISLNKPCPVPTTTMIEYENHSVERILARPYPIATYNVTPSSTVLGNVSAQNIFSDPGLQSIFKLYGFMSFNFNVKIIVNANPYTMGRISVQTMPYLGSRGPNRTSTTSLQALTSGAYMDVDIGAGESAEFCVPFSAPYPLVKCDIAQQTAADYDWSLVRIAMLSPLAGPDTAINAEVTVLAWFSEIIMTVPVAQGLEQETQAETNVSASNGSYVNVSVNVAPTQMRQDMEPPHDTTNLGWLASLLSGASTFFGLSRPSLDANLAPMFMLPARGMGHAVGTDHSVPLALRPDNEVRLDSCMQLQDEDPLDIATFLSHYQCFSSVNWSTTDSIDQVLFSIPLRATNFPSSRLSYVAQNFRFSFGSFCFRLSLVKNAFYSGRLAIEYQAFGPAYATHTGDIPSLIWDLKTNKEAQVQVPFVNQTRFVEKTDPNQSGGLLVIRVINPLRCPDGMPTTIPILLFVSACHDVMFALPHGPSAVYAQGNDGMDSSRSINLAPADPPPPNNRRDARLFDLVPSVKYCSMSDLRVTMGEACLTLRDLITRYDFLGTVQSSAFRVDPWNFGSDPNTKIRLHAMSWYYSYYRGSLKLKIIVKAPPLDVDGNSPPFWTVNARIADANSTFLGFGSASSLAATSTATPYQLFFPLLNPVIEVRTPYYTNVDRLPIHSTDQPIDTCHSVVSVNSDHDSLVYSVEPQFDVYICAGEDFTFLYPVGNRTEM